MKPAAAVAALALFGCATSEEMAEKPPLMTFPSAKPRDAIAECLLNRVTAPEYRPSKTADGGVTVVSFASADALVKPAPTVYLFTIRDSGAGSSTEVRRLGHASLAAAETCF